MKKLIILGMGAIAHAMGKHLNTSRYDVEIVDSEEQHMKAKHLMEIDEARRMEQDILMIRSRRTGVSPDIMELHPAPRFPDIQYYKPHEIKYPITRKSKHNQKKRR